MNLPAVIEERPLLAPIAEALVSYRSVYALCTINPRTEEMKASHYAMVLVGGSSPQWGVWTVQGKFVRYAGSRGQIEKAYPHLTWRRRMATWACVDPEDKPLAARRHEIEERYGRKWKR